MVAKHTTGMHDLVSMKLGSVIEDTEFEESSARMDAEGVAVDSVGLDDGHRHGNRN